MNLSPHDPVADQLRREWFCRVNEISDIGLQRHTWLDTTNRNPHWSYVEFMESYPDDDQLLHALNQGWLSTDEFGILSDLGRVLAAHSPPGENYYDNAAILEDRAWHSVVEAAGRAKQKLLSITTDQHERQMLLGTT